MVSELPGHSPYSYAVNNPILFVDPDGQFPIKFHIRAFAPTGAFNSLAGLGFQDDGRGFTTSTGLNVTSRIFQQFTFETNDESISNFVTDSDLTINRFTGIRTKGTPTIRVT